MTLGRASVRVGLMLKHIHHRRKTQKVQQIMGWKMTLHKGIAQSLYLQNQSSPLHWDMSVVTIVWALYRKHASKTNRKKKVLDNVVNAFLDCSTQQWWPQPEVIPSKRWKSSKVMSAVRLGDCHSYELQNLIDHSLTHSLTPNPVRSIQSKLMWCHLCVLSWTNTAISNGANCCEWCHLRHVARRGHHGG